MAVYEYRCPVGHITELNLPMADEKPEEVDCGYTDHDGSGRCGCCFKPAKRVFLPPAAIHYKGAGTYTNDYKLKYDRKRRKNSADDLPLPAEAAITRAEGAEYDPPKRFPGGVIPR